MFKQIFPILFAVLLIGAGCNSNSTNNNSATFPQSTPQQEECYLQPENPLRKEALLALNKFEKTQEVKSISLKINGTTATIIQESKSWPSDIEEKIDSRHLPCLDLISTFNDRSDGTTIRVTYKTKTYVILNDRGGEDSDDNPVLVAASVVDADTEILKIQVGTEICANTNDNKEDCIIDTYLVNLKSGSITK